MRVCSAMRRSCARTGTHARTVVLAQRAAAVLMEPLSLIAHQHARLTSTCIASPARTLTRSATLTHAHTLAAAPASAPTRSSSTVSNWAAGMARSAVSRALESISEPSAPASAPASVIDERDGETWRAIMNSPVVAEADSVRSEDLWSRLYSHPSTSPMRASSGPSPSDLLGADAGPCDVLDLSSFPGAADTDPFAMIAREMANMNVSIKALLGVDHPVLSTVAKYFFNWDSGKKIRPAMVMLMSHALNAHMDAVHAAPQTTAAGAGAETPSQSPLVTYTADGLPSHMSRTVAYRTDAEGKPLPTWLPPTAVLPLQLRLAEITEMIHTASLLHDDVIDMADTRRGVSSVNSTFGNKLAVLAGDFLLARASVCLARLRNIPVVELLSTVIEHLVKGEVMQMKTALRNEAASRAAVEMYLRKSYYKTGSLIANSCRAIAMLGWYPDYVCNAAFRYGMHTGIAFQLIDDLLDFEGTAALLGKPAMNDMKSGLATAPVLFAAQQFPVLLPIIERKFSAPGDIDAAVKFVAAADGILATRRLAIAHGQMALEAIQPLTSTPSRTALAALVERILSRTK